VFSTPSVAASKRERGGRSKVMLITMASSYIIYCYVYMWSYLDIYTVMLFANFVRIYSLINIKLNV